eukprot:GGOE01034435.1.p7 GENE.GGOE01034435.1~~GGOE01034435.1.p7  ORF type:complete len:135 (-),score=8.54 GGOE01034435.1:126-530(-)
MPIPMPRGHTLCTLAVSQCTGEDVVVYCAVPCASHIPHCTPLRHQARARNGAWLTGLRRRSPGPSLSPDTGGAAPGFEHCPMVSPPVTSCGDPPDCIRSKFSVLPQVLFPFLSLGTPQYTPLDPLSTPLPINTF